MTRKPLIMGAVIAQLAVFVILAVWLTPPRDVAAAAPSFQGDMQVYAPFDPPADPPDIKITDGDGEQIGLDAFAGKVVLLNFWATWCGPCKREMPALDRLQAEMGGSDFAVVAISIDRGGRKVVERWLKSNKIANLGIYLDPKSRLMRGLGTRGLPTSYILDRDGRVAGELEGSAEWDSDEAKTLLKFYME